MTRPSRGDLRSATTTRQTGSFFPPTRVRRMETDMTAQQDSGGGDGLRRSSWMARRRGPSQGRSAAFPCGGVTWFAADRAWRTATAARRRENRRSPSPLALPHQLAEIGHLARAETLHHLAHLAELLDQLVDLLDGGAGALGDPQPPRALDQLGPPALLRGHREDDRLDAVELLLVDLQLGQLVAREARDHPQQRGQRA